MLGPGDPAPQVRAPNQDGETVAPDLAGPTVFAFYPRDDTPGCTTELDQFVREYDTYLEAGVAVYGVSTDGVDSHAAFAADLGADFDLVADPDGAVAAAFGVGLRDDGAAPRTTVVVLDGEVHRVYEAVNPDGHAREVLMDLLEEGVVQLA